MTGIERCPLLAPVRLDYAPLDERLAAVGLCASLRRGQTAPEDAFLIATVAGESHAHAALTSSSGPRPRGRGFRSASGLWRASFAVELELVECSGVTFELTVPGGWTIALGNPEPRPQLTPQPPRSWVPVELGRRFTALAAAALVATATTPLGLAVATSGGDHRDDHRARSIYVLGRLPADAARKHVTHRAPHAHGTHAASSPAHHEHAGARSHDRDHASGRVHPLLDEPTTGLREYTAVPGQHRRHEGKRDSEARAGRHHHHAELHELSHQRSRRHRPSGGAPVKTEQPASSSTPAPTSTAPVLLSQQPAFVAPTTQAQNAWTGGVSSDPALAAELTRLSSLLSLGDRPPQFLIPIYKAAGHRYHVPWQILAAINAIETDYGRNLDTSSAGAIGWMQFMPDTWRAYGVTADGRGVANPYQPKDAIFSAARYLHANGAPRHLREAVFAYNHAVWYVDDVLWLAQAIADHSLGKRAERGYALPLDRRYMHVLGRTDDGIDIETAPDGADVYSITPGIVTAVASDPSGFGPDYPVIEVTRGPLAGQFIYYGHVAAALVRVGQHVAAGQPIAVMGHTGDAAALGHGHIEIGFSDASGAPLNTHGPTAWTPSGDAMRHVIVALSRAFGIRNS